MDQMIKPASVDINTLIKSNTTLSLNCQSNMIELLKKEFTEDENRWYTANLFIYMNYHPTKDFPINLETLVKLVGFAHKKNAKRTLENNFTKDEDYKITVLPKEHGQFATEEIMLNIDTFKNMCMLVKTEKSKQIRKYYVKLENIYNKIVKEEIEMNKALLQEKEKQLEQKDSEHKQNLKISRHKLLIEQLKNKKAVYLCEVGKNLIKIGSSKDIDDRKQNLKIVFGECIFLDVFEVTDFRELEQIILVRLNQYKYKEPINGHISKEVVQLTESFNYNQLKTIVQDEIKNYKNNKELENIKFDFISKMYDDFKNNIITFDQLNILINSFNKKEQILVKEIPNENGQDKLTIIGNDTLKGRKIQLINPDNLNTIVKVYGSMIHVLHDNKTYDKQAILNAIKNNTIYKGFRWLFVEHNQNPGVVNDIKETVVSNQPENHIFIQLNKDKNFIINSFNSIKKIKQEFKIGDRKLHKIIDESLLYNDTYFIKFKDCPKVLINKYISDGNELATRTSSKSKPIKKTNTITKEETFYKSITEAALQSGTSDKSITDSIKNVKELKGFKWEYI